MAGFRNAGIVLAVAALSGCIYVQQPAPQQSYVEQQPAPAPVVVEPAPQPQPTATVVYQAPPQEVVVVYQDDLSPYGRWVDHPRYGRVWIPNRIPNGWQPYTVGHWVYTSDGSCVWVSEDDETQWGPIVYHYGQWAFTSDWGWVWVPGTVWAPAWVAWRDGGGYCGWAPLPPECGYRDQITYREVDNYCPPDRYVYVDEGYMNGGRVDRHIIRNNITIINNTTNITNITVVHNRVVNNGVPVRNVEQRTGRPVERVALADASSPEEAKRLVAAGTPVRYSTPAIEKVQARQKPGATAAQVQAAQQRQTQLNNQLEHDRLVGQNTRQQLNNQSNTDKKLELEDQAARQKQAELDKQIQQQTQADRAKQAELNKEDQAAARQKEAEAEKQAHDQQVEAAKQAEQAKAAAHQKEVEAQQQAAAEREKQAAAEKQAAHDRQVEAQKQAEAERQQQQHGKPQPPADKNKPDKNKGDTPPQ